MQRPQYLKRVNWQFQCKADSFRFSICLWIFSRLIIEFCKQTIERKRERGIFLKNAESNAIYNNIINKRPPVRLFKESSFTILLIVLMIKRVQDYTAFRKSPERDIRREIVEIISFFREEFVTTAKTILFLPSLNETQNRETARSWNLTSFTRGRSRAKVKAKARRRAILGKTFNELFCIAMPRPRYRLSTRSRLLSRIKEYLPHRARIRHVVRSRTRLFRRGAVWSSIGTARAAEKANCFAETTDFQAVFAAKSTRRAAPSFRGTRIDLSTFVSERKLVFRS